MTNSSLHIGKLGILGGSGLYNIKIDSYGRRKWKRPKWNGSTCVNSTSGWLYNPESKWHWAVPGPFFDWDNKDKYCSNF